MSVKASDKNRLIEQKKVTVEIDKKLKFNFTPFYDGSTFFKLAMDSLKTYFWRLIWTICLALN
jgi:hypothetical protein